jgi:glycosyltransferase involved in cell wall biosynthesis
VYLAHSLGGGAEYWLTENLQKHLEVGQGAIVLRGKDDPRKLLVEVHTPNGVTQGLIERENTSGLLGIPQKICLNYSCLVAASDPMGIVKDAMASLRQGDRLIVLFHDYFPLCPSYNLIGADGKYCRLPSSSRCEACYVGMISDRLGRYPTIKDWRQSWKEFLDRANEIVTFSIDSKRHVTKVWPDLTPKTVVRPHILQSSPAQVRRPVGSKVVVGVLGGIGYVKGAEVLKRLSKFTDDRFRIVVIGDMDPTFSDARIHVHGKYARKNISELAKSYGVTCWLFPSIWPETFSFALRECLSTGLPVIGFDLGSQAEALREHQNGTVIPTDIEARDLWRFLINRNDAKAFVGRRVPILGEAV